MTLPLPGRVREALGRAVLCLVTLSVAAAACSSGSPLASPTPSEQGGSPNGSAPTSTATFARIDEALARRVRDDGLAGIANRVVRDGVVLHDKTVGSFRSDTVVRIASASKWLTAATIMTLVDEGRLRLDDPVGRYLPAWSAGQAPDKATITIRQVLSHQAGLSGSAPCLGDRGMSLQTCAARIGAIPLAYRPGSGFRYGNAGYTVAAAVAEVAGGQGIEQLLQARIAAPLGMTRTSFSAPGSPATTNPIPAASAVSTLDDFSRFVATMLSKGTAADGRRVLSEASVLEIERNQVAGVDTRADEAVLITGFRTYGLGVWRDRSASDGTAVMVSGSGSVGFYPWLDRERRTYGVLVVEDVDHQDGHAVRTSTRMVHDLVLPAVDQMPR